MYVDQILISAGVNAKRYGEAHGIMLSYAGQLFGTFDDLKRFQRSSAGTSYFGWPAHHVVEKQDLDRLGVADRFANERGQLCVLLPERAHIGRINSILRNQAPMDLLNVNAAELRAAYSLAYSMIGNYCGGSEVIIRRELMAIVAAIFKQAGL
jgi:hypothetical protein